jgi:phthalate 4,5-cis-dihydrodiol dehydrogenase
MRSDRCGKTRKCPDSSTRRLRVAVVGAGGQATTHLIPSLLQLPEAQLLAVCDPDDVRRTSTAELLGIAGEYCDVATLLDDLDVAALVVACPPQAHEQIAACAIERAVPVFVEKPPAVTSAALAQLATAAETARVATGVGMNFRHAAPYLQLKEVLTSHGQPVSITVRHVASKPKTPLWGLSLLRSFLLAQAIHPVDLLLDLGGPVEDVRTLHRVDDSNVFINAQLAFASGAVGSLLTGTHGARFDSRIEVVTDTGATVSLVDLCELTVAGVLAAQERGQTRGWFGQWRPSPLDTGYERTGFLGELAAFIAAVAHCRTFQPSLGDLLPTYEVLDAIEQECA